MDDEDPKTPPLGVMPERRWRELRVRDLVNASSRYLEERRLDTPEDQTLVAGWMEEGSRHLQWIMDDDDGAFS